MTTFYWFQYRVTLKDGKFTTVKNGVELDRAVKEYRDEIFSIELVRTNETSVTLVVHEGPEA